MELLPQELTEQDELLQWANERLKKIASSGAHSRYRIKALELLSKNALDDRKIKVLEGQVDPLRTKQFSLSDVVREVEDSRKNGSLKIKSE